LQQVLHKEYQVPHLVGVYLHHQCLLSVGLTRREILSGLLVIHVPNVISECLARTTLTVELVEDCHHQSTFKQDPALAEPLRIPLSYLKSLRLSLLVGQKNKVSHPDLQLHGSCTPQAVRLRIWSTPDLMEPQQSFPLNWSSIVILLYTATE